MLVLNRKVGQGVLLFHKGRKIAEIRLGEQNGGRGDLLISADPNIQILREELVERQRRVFRESLEGNNV